MAPHIYANRNSLASTFPKSVNAGSPKLGHNYGMRKWLVERLLELKPQGKSKTGLAGAMSLTPPRITEIINEKRGIDSSEIEAMARYLEWSEAELLARIAGQRRPSGAKAAPAAGATPAVHQPFKVREIKVEAAAGGGGLIEIEENGDFWAFPPDWARVELRASVKDLRIITIIGDSMANPADPLCLYPGDKVVVNTAMRTPSPPGAFVIFDGIGLVAKRAEIVPNSDPPCVLISSANPAYKPYERTLEEAHIIGRIVGTWRRL